MFSFLKIISRPISFLINFFFAYSFYFTSLFFFYLKLNKFGLKLFEMSAEYLLKSLGFECIVNPEMFLNSKDFKSIHIANHDNPFDILLIQAYFCLPTITTVSNHLNLLVPFINYALRKYGHFSFNHKNMTSRTNALRKLDSFLVNKKNIFIFPSGSLLTKITERISPSIYFLSKKHNAKIITWKIKYSKNLILNEKTLYSPFKLLISRIFSPKTRVEFEKGYELDPVMYSSSDLLIKDLKKIYQ